MPPTLMKVDGVGMITLANGVDSVVIARALKHALAENAAVWSKECSGVDRQPKLSWR